MGRFCFMLFFAARGFEVVVTLNARLNTDPFGLAETVDAYGAQRSISFTTTRAFMVGWKRI